MTRTIRTHDVAKAYVGRMAQDYDVVRAEKKNWLAEEAVVVPQLGLIRPGERILDIAAGTGRWLEFLKERGASVILLDVSAEMLAVARKKADAMGLPVEVIVDNALLRDRYPAADWLMSTRFFNWIPIPAIQSVLEKARSAGTKKFMFTVRLLPDDLTGVERLQVAGRVGLRTVKRFVRFKTRYHLHRERDFRAMLKSIGLAVSQEAEVGESRNARKMFFVLTA